MSHAKSRPTAGILCRNRDVAHAIPRGLATNTVVRNFMHMEFSRSRNFVGCDHADPGNNLLTVNSKDRHFDRASMFRKGGEVVPRRINLAEHSFAVPAS